MIDPLDAVIRYLEADADLALLVGGRIAAKHKFSLPDVPGSAPAAWPLPAQALALSQQPGAAPDRSDTTWRLALEALCYGGSQADAAAVANRLIAICGNFIRTPQATSGETALIYWIVIVDSPEFDYDADLHIDVVRLSLEASVAREGV